MNNGVSNVDCVTPIPRCSGDAQRRLGRDLTEHTYVHGKKGLDDGNDTGER